MVQVVGAGSLLVVLEFGLLTLLSNQKPEITRIICRQSGVSGERVLLGSKEVSSAMQIEPQPRKIKGTRYNISPTLRNAPDQKRAFGS